LNHAAATKVNGQSPVLDQQPPAHSSPASSNGKNLMSHQYDSATVLENINSNDEELKELHGDWMFVTRKKKSQPGPTPISKNVANKSNKFSSLSQQAHQVKLNHVTNNYIPKPKFNVPPRVTKSNMETKRRRQDDELVETSFDFPINKNNTGLILSFPTDPHVPLLTKSNTATIGQSSKIGTSHASGTKNQDNFSSQAKPCTTLPHTKDQQAKNKPQHEEINHSAIPQIKPLQATQAHHHETVYAEDNMQVLEKNLDIQEDCHDTTASQNSSNHCDEDMAT